MIGSVSDLSATYYNPGALGLSRASGLLLSTGVYEATSLTLDGSGIQKRQVSSYGFNVAPSLVAGRFPADSGAADRLAYSLLTRQQANPNLQWRFVGAQETIPGVPGSGQVSQEAALLQHLSEMWAGFTLGLGYAFVNGPISFTDNPILDAATGGRHAVATGTKLTSTRLRLIFAFSYAVEKLSR